MLMPSTITALRTRRYDSTWYIPGAIHGVENDPLDGGSRYGIQPPNVRYSTAKCQLKHRASWGDMSSTFAALSS